MKARDLPGASIACVDKGGVNIGELGKEGSGAPLGRDRDCECIFSHGVVWPPLHLPSSSKAGWAAIPSNLESDKRPQL